MIHKCALNCSWVVRCAVTVVLGAIAACGRIETPAPAAPVANVSHDTGSAAPWSGTVLRGSDPVAIRTYLETVREVQPTKFDVHWNPATVAFDKAAAIRALRGISSDGRRFTLDSGEPNVANLKPGSILWIWDITVSKVERVERFDDTTIVHTRPVALNEAIPDGEIAFDTPVNVKNFLLGHPQPPPATKTARLGHYDSAYRLVAFKQPAEADSEPSVDAPGPDAVDDEAVDDINDISFDGNSWSKTLKSYQISFAYKPGADGSLALLLEARDAEGDGSAEGSASEKGAGDTRKASDNREESWGEEIQSVHHQMQTQKTKMLLAQQHNQAIPAEDRKLLSDLEKKLTKLRQEAKDIKKSKAARKELFDRVSENLDVRFKILVDMQGFQAAAGYLFKGGDVQQGSFKLKALSGRASVNFIARLGTKDTRGTKIPVMDIPIVFNIPIPVDGIPFVVQVGTDFLLNVFLAGEHSALSIDGRYEFNGNTGFSFSKTASNYESQMSGDEPQISSHTAWSPGASGALLGVQLPRIGLGLGMFGASSVAYFDVVHALTITNGANVVLGPMLHCSRFTYTAVGHIGIETQVVPIPIDVVADHIKAALSPSKEVFKKEYELLDPPKKGCEIHDQ